MRLIDADVLIKHLCEIMTTANHFGNIERVSEIGACIGVIKGEKAIEQPGGKWIPCSERLPEVYGVYLVTDENGHAFEFDYSDLTTHDDRWSYCRNEIVAWMPLPEPYKKDS